MDKVTYHYSRSTDENGLSHGLCYDFKAVNGVIKDVLHGTMFDHGVAQYGLDRDMTIVALRHERGISPKKAEAPKAVMATATA